MQPGINRVIVKQLPEIEHTRDGMSFVTFEAVQKKLSVIAEVIDFGMLAASEVYEYCTVVGANDKSVRLSKNQLEASRMQYPTALDYGLTFHDDYALSTGAKVAFNNGRLINGEAAIGDYQIIHYNDILAVDFGKGWQSFGSRLLLTDMVDIPNSPFCEATAIDDTFFRGINPMNGMPRVYHLRIVKGEKVIVTKKACISLLDLVYGKPIWAVGCEFVHFEEG